MRWGTMVRRRWDREGLKNPSLRLFVSARSTNRAHILSMLIDGAYVTLTLSRINRRHALQSSLMNSVSSSLSVYHGPPVISTEGSRCASM